MMLAAMSTVLGLHPDRAHGVLGPMAFAIMGGLLVATLLTLIFLPTLYMAVFGRRPAANAAAHVKPKGSRHDDGCGDRHAPAVPGRAAADVSTHRPGAVRERDLDPGGRVHHRQRARGTGRCAALALQVQLGRSPPRRARFGAAARRHPRLLRAPRASQRRSCGCCSCVGASACSSASPSWPVRSHSRNGSVS